MSAFVFTMNECLPFYGDGVAGDGGAGQGAARAPDRRAGMGGAEYTAEPESMDAKLCEDCEAGDSGAGQGAAPDLTCGYTQRMFTNAGYANSKSQWAGGLESLD
jgi:hypothetical protein